MDVLKTKIEVIDLHVPARIGCTMEERSKPQDLGFDIVIYFDSKASCKSDNLEQTIDYMAIQQIILGVCEVHAVALLERLAWISVEKIFKTLPMSEEIHLKIRKFSTMPTAKHVGFELIAHR